MNKRLEYTLSACFALSAAFLSVAAIHREFFAKDGPVTNPAAEAQYDPQWKAWYDSSHITGPRGAKISVLEFGDVECPFCATFEKEIAAVIQKYPGDVRLAFVHFPLKNHRFARPAARAAECAGEQQPFLQLIDHMYAEQDSLGLKAWTVLAAESGVRDTIAFAQCVAEAKYDERIESGVRLGRRLGVRGTPTVYVNGWRVARPPTIEEFDQMVDDARAGHEIRVPGRLSTR